MASLCADPPQGVALTTGTASSDSDSSTHSGRYAGLKPKRLLLAKAHAGARQFFDSAEWALSLQGVVLQDLLPGGAPVDARPVKSTPTPRVAHGPSSLTVEAPRHVEGDDAHRIPAYRLQFSTCDY